MKLPHLGKFHHVVNMLSVIVQTGPSVSLFHSFCCVIGCEEITIQFELLLLTSLVAHKISTSASWDHVVTSVRVLTRLLSLEGKY